MRRNILIVLGFIFLSIVITYAASAQVAPLPATAESLIENARSGNLRAVRTILEQAPDLISTKDKDGFTALHFAACPGWGTREYFFHNDYAGTVELLLNRGADVNAVAKAGITPLHMVVTYRIPRMKGSLVVNGRPYNLHLKEMQKRSLDALLRSRPKINAISKNGMTPLHTAAFLGHADLVSVLLQNGADAKAVTKAGDTALDLARKSKKDEVVSILSGPSSGTGQR